TPSSTRPFPHRQSLRASCRPSEVSERTDFPPRGGSKVDVARTDGSRLAAGGPAMKQLLAWTGSADSTITSEAVMAVAEKFDTGQEVCMQKRGHLWVNRVVASSSAFRVERPLGRCATMGKRAIPSVRST